MTDKYERWNKWAPQFIADLVHDFGFTPEQAAGFVGNFAAESAYFNDIVEDGAIAKGWAGGTGFAQWTGPRRRTFEAWLKKKGFKADSYEGNYSYLFRELKGYVPRALTGLDPNLVNIVKAATTVRDAAWRVAGYFEKPKVINLEPRAKRAQEALELYLKHPVPPTEWATDNTEEQKKMPEDKNVVVMPAEPAKPVLQSKVMQGVMGGVVIAVYAIVQAWQPGVSLKEQPMLLWTAVGGLLTALWTAYGRLSSGAQPITWTQEGADKKAAERTLSGPAAGNGINGGAIPASSVQSPPVPELESRPLEQLSLQQLAHELPKVAELVIGVLVPQLGRITSGLGQLQPPVPPR